MNKQELIEKYQQKLYEVYTNYGEYYRTIAYENILKDLEQLDEPQKVTIPQFVEDLIEYAKRSDWDLEDTFQDIAGNDESSDIYQWYYSDSDNMDTFARAWLDGYEVEKEKRYYVRFKFIEDSYSYLTLIKHLNAWTLSSIKLDKKFRTEHTKKQLEEAGFGWVFDCPGIEIEEVE